jgi:mediator of RNA polymerase II transcription subunit 16
VNKITIAIEAINQGKVIFFAFSDGSVEYRDRVSMAEIFSDGDLEKVWHLSQIGFSYTEDDPCMYNAFLSSSNSNISKACKSHCPQVIAH